MAHDASLVILTVCIGDGELIADSPDDGTVERALRELPADEESFLRLDVDEYDYLQVARTGPDAYYLDFRESAAGPNYGLPGQPFAVALQVLLTYLARGDFKAGHEWQAEAYDTSGPTCAAHNGAQGIGAHLDYYGLADWWAASFSPDETRLIEAAYFVNQDFDDGEEEWMARVVGEELPAGTEFLSSFSSETAGEFLTTLAAVVNEDGARHLAARLADKAKALLDETASQHGAQASVIGLHYAYGLLMAVCYRNRDEMPGALEDAIAAALGMIAIAPRVAEEMQDDSPDLPAHDGFKQLAIIREKQGDYAAAIELSQTALAQGWAGDWEKRIARCQKKEAR